MSTRPRIAYPLFLLTLCIAVGMLDMYLRRTRQHISVGWDDKCQLVSGLGLGIRRIYRAAAHTIISKRQL